MGRHLIQFFTFEFDIVYFCKYFPSSQAFSLMRADHRVYAHSAHHSRGVVASTCAFLAYTSAPQVIGIYKDELYITSLNDTEKR